MATLGSGGVEGWRGGGERAGLRILDQTSGRSVAERIHKGLESNGEHPTQKPKSPHQLEYIARLLNVHKNELPGFIKKLTNEEAKAAIVILQHLTDKLINFPSASTDAATGAAALAAASTTAGAAGPSAAHAAQAAHARTARPTHPFALLMDQLDKMDSTTGIPMVRRDGAGNARGVCLTGWMVTLGMAVHRIRLIPDVEVPLG
eukprot:gene10490-8456_t